MGDRTELRRECQAVKGQCGDVKKKKEEKTTCTLEMTVESWS